MTIFASRLRSFFSESKFAGTLQTYFRSGWAFLIPYLAAYLLYAWLKWPVNPVDSGRWTMVPCLLHVYWVLHAIHVVLGVIALRSWWRAYGAAVAGAADNSEKNADRAALPQPSTVLWSLAPWLCLALLFWIPGIYLEWPSDPWEHLRRINEWHAHSLVTEHSTWKKSSYFLPYSLTQHVTGLAQLSGLNLYYTTVCLLLSWQYYRLARAVGLGARESFVFVLINALTFGNNIFSFYRYYGLSSSILAQIGAVALTRLALEITQNPQVSLRALFRPQLIAYRLSLIAAVPALLALTAFNHIQGLGIAWLGILAVIVWRLIEWKRVMIGWLVLAATLASVATAWWFPRHPALDGIYRVQGWLTAWYGFNVFSFTSPSFERSFQILGALGVLNLGVSVWLLRRNHFAGWLTLTPVLALLLPCFALPLADRLITESNIITFQRFLFAAPAGLALVIILSHGQDANVHTVRRAATNNPHPSIARQQFHLPTATVWRESCAAILPIVLLLSLSLSPGRTGYNRFWQSIQITPSDLRLEHLVTIWNSNHTALAAKDSTATIVTPLAGKIRETFSANTQPSVFRKINGPSASTELDAILNHFHSTPSFLLSTEFRQEHPHPDLSISSSPLWAPHTAQQVATLTTQRDSWLSLGGANPESTASSEGTVLIGNPIGVTTQAFSSALIAIDHRQRYQLACTIRQSGSPLATNYLAVAWYDKNGKLLISSDHAPAGAGSPLGWANGTFSYYGLVNRPAPETWTRYVIVFGSAENAAIPVNAAFIRIGVLLNYNATPGAKIQLKDAVLWQKQSYTNLLLALPSTHNLYSPSSVSAQLSGHWGLQEVSKDHAGTSELRSVVFTGLK